MALIELGVDRAGQRSKWGISFANRMGDGEIPPLCRDRVQSQAKLVNGFMVAKKLVAPSHLS